MLVVTSIAAMMSQLESMGLDCGKEIGKKPTVAETGQSDGIGKIVDSLFLKAFKLAAKYCHFAVDVDKYEEKFNDVVESKASRAAKKAQFIELCASMIVELVERGKKLGVKKSTNSGNEQPQSFEMVSDAFFFALEKTQFDFLVPGWKVQFEAIMTETADDATKAKRLEQFYGGIFLFLDSQE